MTLTEPDFCCQRYAGFLHRILGQVGPGTNRNPVSGHPEDIKAEKGRAVVRVLS